MNQWCSLLFVLALAACSDPPVVTGPSTPATSATSATEEVDAGLPPTKITTQPVSEAEFVETERTRDPFRSFATRLVEAQRPTVKNERTVLLNEYAVDELKPIGIVMASDYPRAMLVDPSGKGWVVKKGDYVGRPETVHLGGPGGSDYQVNWRVDRIRDGDIVLLREDPAQPGAVPLTKVIPLRGEEPTN